MSQSRKVALFNDTAASGHFGCDAVAATIQQSLERRGGEFIYRHDVGKPWERDANAIAAMEDADLVVVNGEGSIHHSSERARSLARIGAHCHRQGIPCYLVNATIQANRDDIMSDLAQFSHVWVRESYSIEELERFGMSVTLCPDLSLYQDFPSWSPVDGVGPIFVDSVDKKTNRALEASAHYAHGLFVSMKKDLNGFGLYYPERYRVSRLFSKYPKKKESLYSVSDFSGFASLLARSRYVITGRFHAFCFCLSVGVPVSVLRSNTWKCEAMLNDLGIDGSRLLDSGRIKKPKDYSVEELRLIKSYVTSARQSIDELFDAILPVPSDECLQY